MARSCFKRSRACGGILVAHFLSRVSGFDMSGNFRPVKRGLRKKRWCCSSVSRPSNLYEERWAGQYEILTMRGHGVSGMGRLTCMM